MPWSQPWTVLRLILLLMSSEFVRTGLLVSYLPLVAPGLHLSAGAVGLIFGVHYLADALAKGPVGVLTERYGLGRVLLLGSGLGLGLLLLLHRSPGLPLLALVSTVWGLCYAALWPGVMAASQHFARPGMTSRALSVTSVSVVPAIVLGLLGVGQLMQRQPGAAFPLLLGGQLVALTVAASLLTLRLPRANLSAQAVPGGAPQDRPGHVPFRERWGRVGVLLPAALAQSAAPGLLATVFYPLLERLNLHLSQLFVPVLLGVLVGAASLWAFGRLADRFHPRAALMPGLLLLALTFLLAGFPGLEGRVTLVTLMLGLAYGAFIAGWNGLVGRTLPPEYRAAAWGTVMAVESLGNAVGPVLGGVMWAAYGQAGVFWSGAGILLLVEGYYLWPGRAVMRRARPPADVRQDEGPA
ncbi:MFS transporter [Deinococcus aquiradiocola]|uniref:MFS transporter n=1 Tax=Deinococcus aquiradiocola TaxID=393059 RepID=A0A917UUN9_9DEIO|nr:MFS transporter [Deinococcus aquiradiocola]GGJ86403.1 MFS transporter [Deinococcus aquiradiocola]